MSPSVSTSMSPSVSTSRSTYCWTYCSSSTTTVTTSIGDPTTTTVTTSSVAPPTPGRLCLYRYINIEPFTADWRVGGLCWKHIGCGFPKFAAFRAPSRWIYYCGRNYAKLADSHLYLPFSSPHPSHCKMAIPHRVALRIKHNCSTDEFFQNSCEEFKGYLESQNYPADLVDKQFEFDKAFSTPRSEPSSKKIKSDKKVFPLVLDYNLILPDIQNVTRKHLHLLHSSPQIKEIFPVRSISPVYRRTKNLKGILAPSKFRFATSEKLNEEEGACSKCGKTWDLCKKKFYSKLRNSRVRPQVVIILFAKICHVRPKIIKINFFSVINAIYSM